MCLISPVQSKLLIQPLVKLESWWNCKKTAKTGKVTAVVAVMSIFKRKRCKLRSASLGNERPSCQKAERATFLQENTRGLQNLSQKLRKGCISKKLASKSEKLELNCTNLMLNSKNTRFDCALVPDPGISSGLFVKNKTVRVLLDSGSCGDLLFIKKGPVNASLLWSGLSLSRGALQTAPLSQTRWVTLKSLLWSTQPAKRYAFSWTVLSTARGNKHHLWPHNRQANRAWSWGEIGLPRDDNNNRQDPPTHEDHC